MNYRLKPLAHALGTLIVLTLAACGGGGDDAAPTPAPVPAPAPVALAPPVTLTGTVMIDMAIRNAVVCMDLNANGSCDADEPASAKTGADGAYSLTYDPNKITATQVAAASLIARMVPGLLTEPNTTIDAADPSAGNTAKAYVLKQLPGRSGQINPLTTLASTGVAGGMTEAVARTNVASQLAIAEAKINGYQDDPLTNQALVLDNARLMAKATAAALEQGAVLQVQDQGAEVAASAGDLAGLSFADASNFSFRTLDTQAKPAGVTGTVIKDNRGGKTAGVPTDSTILYNQAYLTTSGWQRCNDAVNITNTRGTPSRSNFCNALPSVGFTVPSDVAGQTMSAVISSLQADPLTNSVNTIGPGASNALAAATLPPGSTVRARTGLNLARPIIINSISGDGRPQSEATTLEQLIAAKPANAVSLPSPSGTLTLGLGSADSKNLRVAFTDSSNATSGTVQFYECDLDSRQSVASNCAATSAGTYSISTVNDARVMRFDGNAATVMTNKRAYAEVQNAPTVVTGSRVYQVRESKPGFSSNFSTTKRFNATAWAALKTQLGL